MKLEKIVLGIIGVGLVFKFMHWPGAGPMLVVGLSTLSLLYFGGGFFFLQGKEKKEKRTVLAVITGVVLSISCIGILFRLMYWPGAKPMLALTVTALPLLLASVFYLKMTTKPETETDQKLFIRLLIFTVATLALFYVSNKTLLEIQHPNDPEAVRVKSNHFDHPENEAYAKEYQEYIMRQRELYGKSAGQSGNKQ